MGKILQVIERQLIKLELGGTPDYDRLAKALEYCQDFPARCHHPKEDLLYEKLRAYHQVADEVIDDILAEHAALAENCARFLDLVNAFREDTDAHAQRVIREGREFVAFYRRHIDHEERGFFPAALECLAEEDWAEVDARIVDRDDPVFGESAEAGYAALRQEILQNETEPAS